jgi:hypothetical protein
MLQLAPFDWDVINKRAIETLEIEYDELVVVFFYLRMAAGNRSVGNAKRRGAVASDDDRQIFNRKDVTLKSSGNGSESRVHSKLRELKVLSAQVYAYRRLAAIGCAA